MGFMAFVKKDIGKLASVASNPKVINGTVTALGLASLFLGGVKEKNSLAETKAALKSEVMDEIGDELMEKAMAKAMKQLSESSKES